MDQMKTGLNQAILHGLQRQPTKRIVLLASGGVESTASGIILANQGFKIYPFVINYNQKSAAAELKAVKQLSQGLGFQKPVEYYSNILKLGMVNKDTQIIDDATAWIPARNTLFMVMAGIYAHQIDADGIAIGYCLDDNFVFGDNDRTHHQLMQVVLTCSMSRQVDVLMPTISLHKKDLIKILQENEVLEQTVSCWNAQLINGHINVCNECANCLERNKAICELE